MEGTSREWLEKAGKIEDECPHVGCGCVPIPATDLPRYHTAIKCPVCDALMDIWTHSSANPGSSYCFSVEARREHLKASPDCKTHEDWIMGYSTDPAPTDRDVYNAWVEELQKDCAFVPLREFLEQLKERTDGGA